MKKRSNKEILKEYLEDLEMRGSHRTGMQFDDNPNDPRVDS